MTAVGVGDAERELKDLARPQRLGPYVRDVWKRRDFLIRVPLENLRARNMDTVLGNLWHITNPLLLIGIYYLLFGVILDANRGVDNYIPFLAVGVFVFDFIQRSALLGAKSLHANLALIRTMRFPRLILPASSVVDAGGNFVPGLGVTIVVTLLSGVTPRITWLLIPILAALLIMFNLGLAFYSSRLTVHFRDVEQFLPHLFRLAFYMSGVLYSVDALVGPEYVPLFELNPIYAHVTLFRFALLGADINSTIVISALAWTAFLFVSGFLFFRRGEMSYGQNPVG